LTNEVEFYKSEIGRYRFQFWMPNTAAITGFFYIIADSAKGNALSLRYFSSQYHIFTLALLHIRVCWYSAVERNVLAPSEAILDHYVAGAQK
jgi:hypothetical protein